MKTIHQPELAPLHTFAIQQQAALLYQIESPQELVELREELAQRPLVIGEGANMLFVEPVERPLLKLGFAQVELQECDKHYLCRIEAGKDWHQLVVELTESGIGGLENLALIPGSVGAAPIQNIGAYGVEFCQLCQSVEVFDWQSSQFKTLSAQECQFGYRDSIFKSDAGKALIVVAVNLKLNKAWQPQIRYRGIQEQLITELPAPKEIMSAVIQLRQQKLPDPEQAGNAGSFFKNPTVSAEKAEELLRSYPEMPNFPQQQGVKIPAAWLIDQRGWKGKMEGGAQVHPNQALVLVNKANATAEDVVRLSRMIQSDVSAYFGIDLIPEVRFIGKQGEVTLEQAYASATL